MILKLAFLKPRMHGRAATYAADGVSSGYHWGVLGDGLSQGLHDAGVDVEQVVTGHARLAGHSSRDDHQVSTL